MPTLEERVRILEEKVECLSQRQETANTEQGRPWWEKHVGAFRDNPMYEEAMQLASEYRRSQPTPADFPEDVGP